MMFYVEVLLYITPPLSKKKGEGKKEKSGEKCKRIKKTKDIKNGTTQKKIRRLFRCPFVIRLAIMVRKMY